MKSRSFLKNFIFSIFALYAILCVSTNAYGMKRAATWDLENTLNDADSSNPDSFDFFKPTYNSDDDFEASPIDSKTNTTSSTSSSTPKTSNDNFTGDDLNPDTTEIPFIEAIIQSMLNTEPTDSNASSTSSNTSSANNTNNNTMSTTTAPSTTATTNSYANINSTPVGPNSDALNNNDYDDFAFLLESPKPESSTLTQMTPALNKSNLANSQTTTQNHISPIKQQSATQQNQTLAEIEKQKAAGQLLIRHARSTITNLKNYNDIPIKGQERLRLEAQEELQRAENIYLNILKKNPKINCYSTLNFINELKNKVPKGDHVEASRLRTRLAGDYTTTNNSNTQSTATKARTNKSTSNNNLGINRFNKITQRVLQFTIKNTTRERLEININSDLNIYLIESGFCLNFFKECRKNLELYVGTKSYYFTANEIDNKVHTHEFVIIKDGIIKLQPKAIPATMPTPISISTPATTNKPTNNYQLNNKNNINTSETSCSSIPTVSTNNNTTSVNPTIPNNNNTASACPTTSHDCNSLGNFYDNVGDEFLPLSPTPVSITTTTTNTQPENTINHDFTDEFGPDLSDDNNEFIKDILNDGNKGANQNNNASSEY